MFNLESGRLQNSCEVDLSAEGCDSTDIRTLLDELADLINSDDPDNCELAADCAAAVNEGTAVVEGLVLADEPAISLGASPRTISGSSHRGGTAIGTVEVEEATAETVQPSTSPSTPSVVLGAASDIDEPEVADAGAEGTLEAPPVATDDDGLRAIHRHLAVLANANAPERAREVSTNALLTALSGGYEPEIRLEIIQGILAQVDVVYDSLLAGHLRDIQAEAKAFEKQDLAKEAERLLRRLEPSEE